MTISSTDLMLYRKNKNEKKAASLLGNCSASGLMPETFFSFPILQLYNKSWDKGQKERQIIRKLMKCN